tara:strand:- start:292 stop:579 length:288 start_codon:yes stop_codon:yes gene_type:complete
MSELIINKYGKTQGHHCWWLTINGKSVANFDDEKEVDAIIKMQVNHIEIAKKALFDVGGEINEETRLTKNSKSFAVAIVLNKLQDIEKQGVIAND